MPLLPTEGRKDLFNLYRHIVGDPCPKICSRHLSRSTLSAEDLRGPLREYLVKMAFDLAEAVGAPKRVFLSINDNFTEKDRHSKRLESVDWPIDHARSRPKEPVHSMGITYVTLRLTVCHIGLTADIQLYLRQKTVRRLNRTRRRG